MAKVLGEIEVLHLEIEKLTRELDQALSEKVQSAKCGLALLKEKCKFQEKCVKLEVLYENTKHELDITTSALSKLQASQKVTTENGIQHEDALLNESAAMESSFTLQILELENEIKNLRQELERVVSERDRQLQENSEILREKSKIEAEKYQLKIDVKELKIIEANLLTKNNELEDENESLRKQLFNIKNSEEKIKDAQNELKNLIKENDLLRENFEDLTKSNQLVELKLGEALEALEIEREAKVALEKELDAYHGRECMYKTKSLAESIMEIKEMDDTSSNRSRTNSEVELVGLIDIQFKVLPEVSEELRQLEKQLEQLESEMTKDAINNINFGGDKTKNELQNIKSKLAILAVNVDALTQLEKRIETESSAKEGKEEKDIQNDQMRGFNEDMVQLKKELNNSMTDFMGSLQDEITTLKDQLKLLSLELDNPKYILETIGNLKEAKTALAVVSDNLTHFCNKTCPANEEVSTNINLDEESDDSDQNNDSLLTIRSQTNSSQEFELLKYTADVKRYANFVHDNLKYFTVAMEHSSNSQKKGDDNSTTNSAVVQLLKQNDKLQKLLSEKRKQLVILQTDMKKIKQTSTTALQNIREKYEKEKIVVNETICDLIHQIKTLKQEALVFSELRGSFEKRCSEYLIQTKELTWKVDVAQQEKNMLEKILKISLKEKLKLQSRLQHKELQAAKEKKVRFVLPK